MIETMIVDAYQVGPYLNMGYELVTSIVETRVQMQSVQEEVPVTRVFTSSGDTYYNNNGPQYINKQYPVPITETRFLMKRTASAKLLYEKNLK